MKSRIIKKITSAPSHVTMSGSGGDGLQEAPLGLICGTPPLVRCNGCFPPAKHHTQAANHAVGARGPWPRPSGGIRSRSCCQRKWRGCSCVCVCVRACVRACPFSCVCDSVWARKVTRGGGCLSYALRPSQC